MEFRVFDPGQGKAPRTSLIFGNQKINLRPLGAGNVEWFTADHEAAGSDIEQGPAAKLGARGVLQSVYCRDPDGSLIEISSYTVSTS